MNGLIVFTWLAIFAFVCVKYWKSIVKSIHYRAKISRLPNVPRIALPLIGHAYMIPRANVVFFRKLTTDIHAFITDTKAKFWVLWLGPVPLVTVAHPDAAEVILRSSQHIKKSFVYNFLHPWLATGLLTAGGEKWKQRRRLITPTFHFNILQDFLEVMHEQSYRMLQNLDRKVGSGGAVNLGKSVTLCALDIICETAMGQTVNAQDNADSNYVKSIIRMSEIIQMRQKTPFYWWDYAFKKIPLGREHDRHLEVLHGFTQKVIREKIKVKEEKEITKRMAFLDVLIHAKTDQGNSLSFSDIQEEVDTFMFEGHDTTAAAMTWCLFLLAKHPDVQRKVQEEIDQVLPDGRQPTMDDLKDLQYLEQITKETLRLYPSVPMFARVTTEDCEVLGHIVPKDTQVLLQVYNLHRNPWVWDEPEKFDPDRFSKENSAGRHPYAYIPFSAGPRNCIGQKFAQMEEKVILSQLLQRYEVSCEDEEGDLDLVGDLILRPLNPLRFKLKRR